MMTYVPSAGERDTRNFFKINVGPPAFARAAAAMAPTIGTKISHSDCPGIPAPSVHGIFKSDCAIKMEVITISLSVKSSAVPARPLETHCVT